MWLCVYVVEISTVRVHQSVTQSLGYTAFKAETEIHEHYLFDTSLSLNIAHRITSDICKHCREPGPYVVNILFLTSSTPFLTNHIVLLHLHLTKTTEFFLIIHKKRKNHLQYNYN